MGLKSMHAEKQSEQPQQSVQDNSLIEQQSQRIAELMKEQEQDTGTYRLCADKVVCKRVYEVKRVLLN